MKVLGTTYIFVCDRASPSWKKIRLVVMVSGENFLLSNGDLKNLSILAADFPSYLGRMRKQVLDSAPISHKMVLKIIA